MPKDNRTKKLKVEREIMKNLLWIIVVGLLLLARCGTVKGLAHDISWTAGKIDDAIVVPE